VLEAINVAQRKFVLLSLCLEQRVGLLLSTSGVVRFLVERTDFICALRMQTGTGLKIRPATVHELAARNEYWRSETADVPTHYAVVGWDYGIIYPAPAATTNASLTYARGPAVMSLVSTPEIPVAYHPALIDAAVVICRLKEGGQELQKEIPRWKLFIAAALSCRELVRRRNQAAGYDRVPRELMVK